jgi:hypothetical protein
LAYAKMQLRNFFDWASAWAGAAMRTADNRADQY